MPRVRFTSLSEVTLRNATTGAEAPVFRLAADGSWAGFLKLAGGRNRIEVAARAEAGARALRALEVQLDPGMPPPAVPRRFVVQRNELLKICLDHERSLRVSLERERREQVGRQLTIEIESARGRARERAAGQRRELQISVEEHPPERSAR